MLFAACEGRHWRYEVCEHADGYLVRMRDLQTGDVDEDSATVFRTMPVAFAFAELSAALERHVVALEDPAADDDTIVDLAASERNFVDLRDRLSDAGTNEEALRAWERAGPRRVYH